MRNKTTLLTIIVLALSIFINVIAAEVGPKARIANPQVDFDKIEVGKNDTKKVTIENKGNAKLEITKLASNSPAFTPMVAEKVIEPGKSADIQIKFDSTGIDPCVLIKYIYVYTNDPDLKERSIPITCKATVVPVNSPLIQLTPYEIDLGIVNPGEKVIKSVTYNNVGTAKLEVEPIQYVDKRFTLLKNISAKSLEPGGSGAFEITFEGKEPGVIDSYIIVKSNTAGGPYSKIAVKGQVVEKNITITGVEIALDKDGKPLKTGQYNLKLNNYYAPYQLKVTLLNGKQKGRTFSIQQNSLHTESIDLDPNEPGKKISLQLDIIIEEPKTPATEEKKPAEGEKAVEEKKPEDKLKTGEEKETETKASEEKKPADESKTGDIKSGETKSPESGEKEKTPEEDKGK